MGCHIIIVALRCGVCLFYCVFGALKASFMQRAIITCSWNLNCGTFVLFHLFVCCVGRVALSCIDVVAAIQFWALKI